MRDTVAGVTQRNTRLNMDSDDGYRPNEYLKRRKRK